MRQSTFSTGPGVPVFPQDRRYRRWRQAGIAGAVGVVAGVALATAWRDPHLPGSWGRCPWLVATGTPCPICGGLRALADLVGGRPDAAWMHHPYLVTTLLFTVLLISGRVRKLMRGRMWLVAAGWLAGLVLFGLARGLNPQWWLPLGAG